MNTGLFPPPKRTGLLFHAGLLVGLAALSAWSFVSLSRTPLGIWFIAYLVLGLLAFVPIPLLAYRAYALYTAQYRLDRDSLELRWGLRDEVIPLSDIEWVRPEADLTNPLSRPALALPGGILGLRRHRDLGHVEFMASTLRPLLLVGTADHVYAISPAETRNFLDTFARAVELGSLRTADAASVYPSFVLAHAWKSGPVRFLWLAALFLNLGLAAWVSMLIPATREVSLGYRPEAGAEPVTAAQLIILPLVSSLLGLTGWIGGLYLFRVQERKAIAMVLWVTTALSGLLFLLAMVFIVLTPR